jgi:hypothetical protein
MTMSAFTGVVTTRDVLEWAIVQGVFTHDGTHVSNGRRPVTKDVQGPWKDVLLALVTCAAEAVADKSFPTVRYGGLEGFEDYVDAHCLANIVNAYSLTPQQAGVARALAGEIRLFFDASTISIGMAGLDGPVDGDLYYHCAFDFEIDVPKWAMTRAQP